MVNLRKTYFGVKLGEMCYFLDKLEQIKEITDPEIKKKVIESENTLAEEKRNDDKNDNKKVEECQSNKKVPIKENIIKMENFEKDLCIEGNVFSTTEKTLESEAHIGENEKLVFEETVVKVDKDFRIRQVEGDGDCKIIEKSKIFEKEINNADEMVLAKENFINFLSNDLNLSCCKRGQKKLVNDKKKVQEEKDLQKLLDSSNLKERNQPNPKKVFEKKIEVKQDVVKSDKSEDECKKGRKIIVSVDVHRPIDSDINAPSLGEL